MTQEDQQQQGQQEQQQQELSSEQRLGRALTEIRKVQSMMELSYPDQGQAIQMLRDSGDLVWSEIKHVQQQQAEQQQAEQQSQ